MEYKIDFSRQTHGSRYAFTVDQVKTWTQIHEPLETLEETYKAAPMRSSSTPRRSTNIFEDCFAMNTPPPRIPSSMMFMARLDYDLARLKASLEVMHPLRLAFYLRSSPRWKDFNEETDLFARLTWRLAVEYQVPAARCTDTKCPGFVIYDNPNVCSYNLLLDKVRMNEQVLFSPPSCFVCDPVPELTLYEMERLMKHFVFQVGMKVYVEGEPPATLAGDYQQGEKFEYILRRSDGTTYEVERSKVIPCLTDPFTRRLLTHMILKDLGQTDPYFLKKENLEGNLFHLINLYGIHRKRVAAGLST